MCNLIEIYETILIYPIIHKHIWRNTTYDNVPTTCGLVALSFGLVALPIALLCRYFIYSSDGVCENAISLPSPVGARLSPYTIDLIAACTSNL